MKINIQKLKEAESKYKNSNPIVHSSIEYMLNVVLSGKNSSDSSFIISYNTLVSLGIIDEEKDSNKNQQLNS